MKGFVKNSYDGTWKLCLGEAKENEPLKPKKYEFFEYKTV